jgi:CubicO group peptidase (beta-lactamase class C family)
MRRRDVLKTIALAGAATAGTARAQLREDKLEEASALIERAVASGDVSAATLTVRRGANSFRRHYGAADSADTIFLIASITKPMTATGIMVLADRGKLSLKDPVRRYIPEFNEGDRKLITIQQLLTHSSGLPDQLPENVELRQRHAPLSEFVERAIRTPLIFKPGTQVKYQSMGLLLASEVAQRITGQPFPEFLDEVVYRPLEMSRTALGLGPFEIADTARCQVTQAPALYGGASADTSSWDWNSRYWRTLSAPWGGAHSTGPDIEKFLRYFLAPTPNVLKPATAASMIVDHNQGLSEPRGLGFVVKAGSFGKGCSAKTYGHGGATGTIAWADPATGLSCVILTTLPSNISNKTVLNPASDLVGG